MTRAELCRLTERLEAAEAARRELRSLRDRLARGYVDVDSFVGRSLRLVVAVMDPDAAKSLPDAGEQVRRRGSERSGQPHDRR